MSPELKRMVTTSGGVLKRNISGNAECSNREKIRSWLNLSAPLLVLSTPSRRLVIPPLCQPAPILISLSPLPLLEFRTPSALGWTPQFLLHGASIPGPPCADLQPSSSAKHTGCHMSLPGSGTIRVDTAMIRFGSCGVWVWRGQGRCRETRGKAVALVHTR